jgi:hypothetical protein
VPHLPPFAAQCQCPNAKLVPAGDGVVRVSRSSKGRGGKTVTLVQGLALPADELAALGKRCALPAVPAARTRTAYWKSRATMWRVCWPGCRPRG